MPLVPPYYQERTVYGPFRRRESPTQDAATVVKQVLSGELWGRKPRRGLIPAAEAYNKPLRPAESGIEFWTFEPPAQPHGNLAFWSSEGPFVTIDQEMEVVKLSIVIARITQDLMELAI